MRRPRDDEDDDDEEVLLRSEARQKALGNHAHSNSSVETVMAITQCTSEVRARACLASAQGDVEQAISIHFDTHQHFNGDNDDIVLVELLQQIPRRATAAAAAAVPAADAPQSPPSMAASAMRPISRPV